MNNKTILLLVFVIFSLPFANAQKSKYDVPQSSKTEKKKTENNPTSTNAGANTKPKTPSKYDLNTNSNANNGSSNGAGGVIKNPSDSIPGGGDVDTLLKNMPGSKPTLVLKNGYGVDKSISSAKERTPLAYEHLRDEDATYSQFVWREINAKEKINQSFIYGGKDEFNRKQTFFSILMDAILNDSITAFAAAEGDRFVTPITDPNSIITQFAGKVKAVTVFDPELGRDVTSYTRGSALVQEDSIYTFRIKEQWIFDKESSRMFVRIIGIAPIYKSGSTEQILFWMYYPELRATLAKYDVYNPKNSYGRMTWEDLFEGRMFNSYIVKSTVDNPSDAWIKNYPNLKDNKLFQLYEGENVKEKIFNYEQNQWAY